MKISDFPLWETPSGDMEIPVIHNNANGRLRLEDFVTPGDLDAHEQECAPVIEDMQRRLAAIEEHPAMQPDFNNVLENLEQLSPILESIFDRLDAIEAKPAMQPDFNNMLENIEGLSPILESIFDRLDALEDQEGGEA